MSQVVISTKYQVVIPRLVREMLGLVPGQSVQVLTKGGVIHLIPIKPIEQLRGFAKGANPKTIREKKDRM